MLDQVACRVRYSVGNGVRFVTRPWRQWTIAPEEATTIFACGFGVNGWNHLCRTIAEISGDPNIPPQATTLWRYLKWFQPASISALAGSDGLALPPFVYPWGTFRSGVVETDKSAERSRFCGPSEDAFIIDEFERMKALYAQMRESGYRPTTFPHSFIGGTWLISLVGQRRFVVLQGNHRMAILAHLGWRGIAVRTIPGYLSAIYERDIKTWPLVSRGSCSEEHARAIFDLFFRESGFQIAKHLAG